jgi:hypothetical protein
MAPMERRHAVEALPDVPCVGHPQFFYFNASYSVLMFPYLLLQVCLAPQLPAHGATAHYPMPSQSHVSSHAPATACLITRPRNRLCAHLLRALARPLQVPVISSMVSKGARPTGYDASGFIGAQMNPAQVRSASRS